ncbi:MAG: hypothetical protein LBM08_01035 [Dysgonamonadaceae bacterium]|jgi:hypothetical protein|nr:hypothetical protein [Dysgonamonadaceae bacterium]
MVELQKKIINSRLSIPLTILLIIGLRLHAGVDLLSPIPVAVLLIHIGIAFSLFFMNHSFNIIRRKTTLPSIFFLLTTGTNAYYFTNLTASVITLLIILCLICTFASYRNPDSQRYLFNISILLSVGALLWLPAIFFLPLFWLSFIQFKAFNGKSLLASLLGILLVLLFVFTWAVYEGNPENILQKLLAYRNLFPADLDTWSSIEIVRALYIAALSIISLIYLMRNLYSEKIKSQTILFHLYIFFMVTMIGAVFFFSEKYIFCSMLYLFASLIISYLFTLFHKKFVACLLLFSLLFYISTYFIAYYETILSELYYGSF